MIDQIGEAFYTAAGMLWKALWALVFGYLISSAIQVLVTREQMARVLGNRGLKQVSLAGLFGFVSSSCSFAALAATRTIWTKGAHAANAVAFLIASTNLVIELGIVLLVLLGWHFFVGNLVLGLLMIVYTYLLTKLWFPARLAEHAREHAEQAQGEEMTPKVPEGMSWREKLTSRAGWQAVADAFVTEWRMVWKEILFGFTVAGFISVFVPQSVWNALFLAPGEEAPSVLAVLQNAAVAPVIAFFTFIGSMGNVPLAAMLWAKGNSFGGVMSFLGADLVAATVIWIHAKYYGWRYALYLSGLLYVAMVAAGITAHYLFALVGALPTQRPELRAMIAFAIDYTFWLNLVFVAVAGVLLWLHGRGGRSDASTEQRRAEPARADR